MAEARYRIGAAARLTGLTTHVIRVWERRYRVLAPSRSQGGARLYSETDLERLRLLRRAVAGGHAIGQIAALDDAALKRLLAAQPADAPAAPAQVWSGFAEDFKQAVGEYDLARADRVLSRAIAQHSPRALLIEILGPALQHIGDAWARGEICVGSEHLASTLVRDCVGALLRSYSADPGAESIVLTTPAGEQHELGVQLAAALAAMYGFRVIYLGANLPAGEIVDAVRRSGAKIAALSVVALDVGAARREISSLLDRLPEGVMLLLGGARALEVWPKADPRVEIHTSLTAFDRWLALRSEAAGQGQGRNTLPA
jgi:methanogenic corrinoid protein MtbC1